MNVVDSLAAVRGGGVASWGPRAGVPLTLHSRNMLPSSQILKANLV